MAFSKSELDSIKSKIPISVELEKKTKINERVTTEIIVKFFTNLDN